MTESERCTMRQACLRVGSVVRGMHAWVLAVYAGPACLSVGSVC